MKKNCRETAVNIPNKQPDQNAFFPIHSIVRVGFVNSAFIIRYEGLFFLSIFLLFQLYQTCEIKIIKSVVACRIFLNIELFDVHTELYLFIFMENTGRRKVNIGFVSFQVVGELQRVHRIDNKGMVINGDM